MAKKKSAARKAKLAKATAKTRKTSRLSNTKILKGHFGQIKRLGKLSPATAPISVYATVHGVPSHPHS